jgi:HK97 family phage major capsid protein
MTSGTSTAYVAESTNVAETTPAFDSVSMSPSTLGTYTQMSRKMLLQSDPSVEQLVMNDFARAMAVKLDQTILYGTGSGAEPTGILNLASMSAQLVTNGTNGAVETWAKVVEYESNVTAQNAGGSNMKYVLHPSLAGAWKTQAKDSGSGLFLIENGMANGYEVLTTTVLPSTLTKGTNTDCFGTVFGDFSQAILGMWGGLDILSDPYSGSAQGTLRLVALQDVDFNVRHKEAFAISEDSRTS